MSSGNLVLKSVPAPVQGAFLAWLGAIAAGVAETAVRVGTEPWSFAEVALRVAIYCAAVCVFVLMRAGRNWARLVLTVVLGVVGTLSLVIEPVAWLADGNSLGDAIARAGAADWAIALSRGAHLAAVVVAMVLMYVPAANRYFRGRAS
jgi:hypothetical protein